jgi:hypothetical protein
MLSSALFPSFVLVVIASIFLLIIPRFRRPPLQLLPVTFSLAIVELLSNLPDPNQLILMLLTTQASTSYLIGAAPSAIL